VSLFKYMGGKYRRRKDIVDRLERIGITGEYREPFVGGASVAVEYLTRHPVRAWLNDADPSIASIWRAVRDHPAEFAERIDGLGQHFDFKPLYRRFQARLEPVSSVPGDPTELLDVAVSRQAVQMISLVGEPTGRGGSWCPGDYAWNPGKYRRAIERVSPLLRQVGAKITARDFSDVLLAPGRATVYLDPPYYSLGTDLYRVGFSPADHLRLCRYLRESKHRWLLSYDDHYAIHRLYRWARVERVRVMNKGVRQYRSELLISPPD
jgi:DNA adenine methylase